MTPASALTPRRIIAFWAPLAATWLMMAAEGPFLAAVIARLAEPKLNLAAFGVSLSFAMLIEAPIIMVMSASTALVRDRQSFLELRRFTYALNVSISLAMVILLTPPVFHFVTQELIGLPANVADLTHTATTLLVPWPAAIGYRRFFQGILIRNGLTRRVAYGTVLRLVSMVVTGLGLYLFSSLPGAMVGAAALSVGVVCEAAASRWWARALVRRINAIPADVESTAASLTMRQIVAFYWPLALTSLLTLGVHPLVTFFLGRSRLAVESLAVLPVVNALTFIVRSTGIAYQEVGIALLGERGENYRALARFARRLAAVTAAVLALVAFTPAAVFWFQRISGLSGELTALALLPIRILAVMPALEVWLSFQRAMLVARRSTAAITWATAVEVTSIVVVLLVTVRVLGLVGVNAAAFAYLVGRCVANGYLATQSAHPTLSSP